MPRHSRVTGDGRPVGIVRHCMGQVPLNGNFPFRFDSKIGPIARISSPPNKAINSRFRPKEELPAEVGDDPV